MFLIQLKALVLVSIFAFSASYALFFIVNKITPLLFAKADNPYDMVKMTVEEIKEIIIRSSKLIGVLEVDVKQVPKDRFTRIKINGIRQTYEIARPRAGDFASPIAALFQPVDFLYKLFGKKPKQLKKLQKIKKEDNLRKIMAGKFDREVMMEYLEMDRNDLMKLISDCNYSDYFVKNASDLQMIEAVLDCYETYKALKLGKIERSRLPTKKRN